MMGFLSQRTMERNNITATKSSNSLENINAGTGLGYVSVSISVIFSALVLFIHVPNVKLSALYFNIKRRFRQLNLTVFLNLAFKDG